MGLNVTLPYDPAISLLGIYPKEMKSLLKKYLHPHVLCSITHSSQDMERNLIICQWMVE